jgi:prepilin-type N-terminal cleavage/methylation domain-containing protein
MMVFFFMSKMKPMKIFSNRKAFALIELIVVVSIIAILMSIIIPVSQKVFTSARKSKAQAAMKQIAQTYCRYYQDNGYIPTATDTKGLIKTFAEEGELNNADLFIFPGDSKAATVLRENVCPWVDANDSPWTTGKQLSVALVGNIMKEVNQSTTPIAYSRGLGTNGKWTADGVWGTDGGFIGFLDGQVRWFKDLATDDNQLSIAKSSTSDITIVVNGVGGKILGTGT